MPHVRFLWSCVVRRHTYRTLALNIGLTSSLIAVHTPRVFATTIEPLFTAPYYTYAGGAQPADIDNSGTIDLLGPTSLLGNGDLTFLPSPIAVSAELLADLNSDLLLDAISFQPGPPSPAFITVALASGPGTFLPPTAYEVPRDPSGVAVADFNHDGALDLVLCTTGLFSSNGTLCVFMNTGDGTYGSRTDVATGLPFPVDVAVGDFLEDGHPDVAVVLQSAGGGLSGFLQLYPGTGTGVDSTLSTTILVDRSPQMVAIGDIDGDTHLDIAVANAGSANVTVALGDGLGQLPIGGQFAAPFEPYTVGLADMNADSHLDMIDGTSRVATIGTRTTAAIRLGVGDGTFGPVAEYPTLNAGSGGRMRLADLDSDGDQDVVTEGKGLGAVPNRIAAAVHRTNANGTLDAPSAMPAPGGSRGIVVADFDGDMIPDIAASDGPGSQVFSYRGLGAGVFASYVGHAARPAASPGAMASGDFDQDGRADVVVANTLEGSVSVFFGQPGGGLGGRVDYGTGAAARAVAVGHLNADNAIDCAVANFSGNSVTLYFNDGMGTFIDRLDRTTGGTPVGIAIGDLTGDGRSDIVTVAHNDSQVWLILQNSIGGFLHGSLSQATLSLPEDVALGDMNLDGRLDVVVCNRDIGGITIHPNNGSAFLPIDPGQGTGTRATAMALSALNSDSSLDVAAVDPGTGVAILTGNADLTMLTHNQGLGVASAPLGIAAGDLNSDGRKDLAVIHGNDPSVWLYFGTGAAVDVPQLAMLHARVWMGQPYPNPASGYVHMSIEVPNAQPVDVRVFDTRGRLVRHLYDGHSAQLRLSWDGMTSNGVRLPPGLYFVEARTSAGRAVRRLTLL